MASTSDNSSSNHHYLSRSQGREVNSRGCQVAQFSKDEEALIIRMFNLVGDRWSLIAGRVPGRTAEEIKKYWIAKEDTYKQQ